MGLEGTGFATSGSFHTDSALHEDSIECIFNENQFTFPAQGSEGHSSHQLLRPTQQASSCTLGGAWWGETRLCLPRRQSHQGSAQAQCEPHSWRHHATLWHKITAHLGGDHNHGAFCLGKVCLPVVQAPLRALSPTTIACTASPLKGPTAASASEDVSTHRGAQCHVRWSTAHHHPCAQGLRREVRPRAFESHLAGDRPEAKVPPRHCDTWAK